MECVAFLSSHSTQLSPHSCCAAINTRQVVLLEPQTPLDDSVTDSTFVLDVQLSPTVTSAWVEFTQTVSLLLLALSSSLLSNMPLNANRAAWRIRSRTTA